MSDFLPKKFVSLHSHCRGSMNDGFGKPIEHINYVRENGGTAWCLTDHGNMNAIAQANISVKDINSKGANFKFVPGCEMYLHPDLEQWRRDYSNFQLDRTRKTKDEEDEDVEAGLSIENEDHSKKIVKAGALNRRHHLVVLPKSALGLSNLFNLVTLSFQDGNYYRYPRIDFKMLKEFGQDLIVSTACVSGILAFEIFSHFDDVSWDKLEPSLLERPGALESTTRSVLNVVDRLVDCVGRENTFLELQFNKLGAQHLVNRVLLEASRRSGLDLVVTCDSHYPRPELWKAREIYKKLAWMKYESINPDDLPKSKEELKCELYPKNAEQVWNDYKQTTQGFDFYDDSVVSAAIERTHDIVYGSIGPVEMDCSIKLPKSVVPAGKTAIQALYELCKEQLVKRGLASNPVYSERLKKELSLLKEKSFEAYFLMMREVMAVARKSQIIGPGRGSSVGSLVNYLLSITAIDPIKHNVLFERFISRAREGLPDIDSDFSDRDKLFVDLEDHFGKGNVLYISNYNTFKLKSLVKDVSKFYGIPFDEVNEVTKVVEQHVKNATLKQGDDKNLFELKYSAAIEHSPPFKAFMEKHPDVAETVQLLDKQDKSVGRHAGGLLILDNPERNMPVIRVRGLSQSPFVEGLHEKTLEVHGYVKIDCLGLDTLRIIQRCIEYILMRKTGKHPSFEEVQNWYTENLHPDRLDMDDPDVYENVYNQSRFPAIFQFTSCLDESTPVTLSSGEKRPISQIRSGDRVLSYDVNKSEFVSSEVEARTYTGKQPCIELSLENGKKIVVTEDHLFLTKNRGWVSAGDLEEDDDIVEPDGNL